MDTMSSIANEASLGGKVCVFLSNVCVVEEGHFSLLLLGSPGFKSAIKSFMFL